MWIHVTALWRASKILNFRKDVCGRWFTIESFDNLKGKLIVSLLACLNIYATGSKICNLLHTYVRCNLRCCRNDSIIRILHIFDVVWNMKFMWNNSIDYYQFKRRLPSCICTENRLEQFEIMVLFWLFFSDASGWIRLGYEGTLCYSQR